jgi:hypothetical protein
MKISSILLATVFVFGQTMLMASSATAETVTFPGGVSSTVPELNKSKFVIDYEGGLSFLAWNYDSRRSVAAAGQEVCEFLGFKSYVDSTIKESTSNSMKVVIPKFFPNQPKEDKYSWGWENALQNNDVPSPNQFKHTRYGYFVPFMIFDSLTCKN